MYFEKGSSDDRVLRESGFREFPALCPRWATVGGDIYGNSPAMEALGDIKQLQHEQMRKAMGIDYKTKPPLQVPVQLKNQEVNMLPGGITYVDAASPTGGCVARSRWRWICRTCWLTFRTCMTASKPVSMPTCF